MTNSGQKIARKAVKEIGKNTKNERKRKTFGKSQRKRKLNFDI